MKGNKSNSDSRKIKTFWVDETLEKRLNKFQSSNAVKLSISIIIRQAIDEFIKKRGF